MCAGTISIRAQVEGDAEVKRLRTELEALKKSSTNLPRSMDQTGKSIDGVGKSSTKVTTQVRSMGDKVQQAGSGMALAGAAAVSLFNAYDNVSDSAQKVRIAEGRLVGSQRMLSVAREQLNKLQADGTASALDLEQAQQRVAASEAMVTRANLGLTNSQEALNEAWLNAATSAIPAVFTGVSGLTQVHGALTQSVDESIDSYLRQASALQGTGVEMIEASGNTTEYAVASTEAAGSTLEMTDAVGEMGGAMTEMGAATTEVGAGMTELGANVAETGGAFTELGGTVIETGADIGEFAGDATEMSGALLESGSAALETTANFGELGADVAELGGAFTELGADIAEFSGDTLEFSGNIAEVGGAAAESSGDIWQMGNDVGTMGGALVEAESALVTTAASVGILQDRLKTMGKTLGVMTLMFGKVFAAIGGVVVGIRLAQENFGGLQTKNDELWRSIDRFIPGAYEWARSVDAMATPAEEFIGTLGGLIPLSGEAGAATDELGNALEDLSPEAAAAEQAVASYNQSLSGLSPLLQQTAQAWQLYDNAQAATDQRGQNILAYFQKLDGNLQTARQGVLDLALANGMDLNQALSMTDDQMAAYILNISELGPTAEQQAEMTKQAAEEFAKAWMDSFSQIQSAQQEWAGTMSSALGKMGQELGEEMEVGLSDLEKKVSKGFAGFSDQFFTEIFPEDFLANAIIEGNDAGDIAKELKDLMGDVVDEDLVSSEQAKMMLQPMIDYFSEGMPADANQALAWIKDDLPEDVKEMIEPAFDAFGVEGAEQVEKSMGFIAGQLPHLMEKWTPVMLNGMIPVGGAAKEGIKTHIMDPMLQGLSELPTGASGQAFGQNILNTIQSQLPMIESVAGSDVADMFRGIMANAELTTDEKVQSIIALLGQISPAWAEQLTTMDQDADGIADIVDDKILGPVEQMKLGILEAFQAIFEAMGNQDWANALQGEINEINGVFDDTTKTIDATVDTVDYAGDEIINSFDKIRENGFKVVGESADGTKVQIQSMSDDGVQAMVDLETGAVTAMDGSITSFKDLGTESDTTKEKIQSLKDLMTTGWGGATGPAGFTGLRSGAQQQPMAGTGEAAPTLEGFIPDFSALPGMILDALNKVDASGLVTGLGTWLQQKFTEGLQHLGTWFQNTMLFQDLPAGLANQISQLDATELINGLGSWLQTNFIGGLVSLGTWFQNTMLFQDLPAGLANQISQLDATELINGLGSWLQTNFIGGLQNLGTWFQDTMIFEDLPAGIARQIEALPATEMVSALGQWLQVKFAEGIGKLVEWFSGGTQLFAGVGKGIADAIGRIPPGEVVTAVKEWLTNAVQTGIDEGETALRAIPSIGDTIADAIFGPAQDALMEQAPLIPPGQEEGFLLGDPNALVAPSTRIGNTAGIHLVGGLQSGIQTNSTGLVTPILDEFNTLPAEVEAVNAEAIGKFEQDWNTIGQDIAGQDWGSMFVGFLDEVDSLFMGTDGKFYAMVNGGLQQLPPLAQQVAADMVAKLGTPSLGALSGAYGPGGTIQTSMTGWIEPTKQAFTTALDSLKTIMTQGWGKAGGAAVGPAGFGTGLYGGSLLGRMGNAPVAQTPATPAAAAAPAAAPTTPPVPDFSQHIAKWTEYQTKVHAILESINQYVAAHVTHVGGQITVVGQHLINLITAYGGLMLGAHTSLESINQNWAAHAGHVGGQISITGQHIINLITAYGGLMQGAHAALENANQNWAAHAGHVGGQVNATGQHIIRLITGYGGLMQGVHQALENANQNWAAHAGHVRSMVTSGINSVGRLADAVGSNMSRIASSMNNARSAANNLRSAINSLQNKTITVTTRYVTSGSKPSGASGTRRTASGFSGIVTQPTRFFAGEGNRPEMVQVTPLSPNASGGVHMNRAATVATTTTATSLTNVFQQPTIRAGKSKSNTKKRADSIIFFPDGTKAVYTAEGNVKIMSASKNVRSLPDGGLTLRNSSVKEKGIKGVEALKKGIEPKSEYSATGMERTVDPLTRRGPTGLTGRGGKSLFDLRYASGPMGEVTQAARTHGRGSVRWVIGEKRYEDGSYRRWYNDGTFEVGRDVFRADTRYVKSKLKEGKSVKGVKYFKNGVGVVTYYDGSEQKIKHNHPGPFEEGGKNKEDKAKKVKLGKKYSDMRYATKAARHGFKGIVNKPTQILAGEGGRAEYVSIQPLQESIGRAASAAGGAMGAAGGKPVVLEIHVHGELNGREIANFARKEILGGIYSMT